MASVPNYRRHPNGQAFVYHKSIPSRDHRMYLGAHGSEESLKRYRQFLARLESSTPEFLLSDAEHDRTLDELILLYLEFAEGYYCRRGRITKEFLGVRDALRPLSELAGSELGRKFGPRALGVLQKVFVSKGYARSMVNKQINRVKRFFRWCCRNEYLPPHHAHGLECVPALKWGQYDVREAPPILPVKWHVVERVLPFMSPQVAAMVQTQYMCGMRPQDVTIMRRRDIDTSGEIWLYRPYWHKTAYRGDVLVKAIPRKVQAILKPFFKPNMEAYLFSPQETWAWQREHRPTGAKAVRKTKIYPCEVRARERRKAAARRHVPLRPKGDHYTTDSYRRAIDYAIKAANRAITAELAAKGLEATERDLVPAWSPNQLRHGIATEIRQAISEQAAQRWLGHDSLETTAIYAEKEIIELVEIANALDQRWAV